MTGKQRRHLRALAHRLSPAVQIGREGLTEAVVRQAGTALEDHELIKVKLGTECPIDRHSAAARLSEQTGCEVAGLIGRVLILYRPHPQRPRIRLPAPAENAGGTP